MDNIEKGVSALNRLVHNRESFTQQALVEPGKATYWRVPRRLDDPILALHMRGRLTVATYQVDEEGTSKVLTVDFDDQQGQRQAVRVASRLARAGIDCLIEASRGGRAHLWVMLAAAVSAQWLYWAGLGLLADCKLAPITPRDGVRPPKELEVRPYSTEPGGSGIRLPLGLHRKELPFRAYPFLDSQGRVIGGGDLDAVALAMADQGTRERSPNLAAQIEALQALAETPTTRLAAFAALGAPPERPAVRPGPQLEGQQLIKQANNLVKWATSKEAVARGRNRAGFDLAVQLRDSGLSQATAERYMRDYANAVRDQGDHSYTETEALRALRSAYRRPARDPLPKSA